jgi:hypothetical protein
MLPRIYTYKVTFSGRPEFYFGCHKEKKFGESYFGSPKTHKEFFRNNIHLAEKIILEEFDFSDDGWKEARLKEKFLILPNLNNPLCLNENSGGTLSLASLRAYWDKPENKEQYSRDRKQLWRNQKYREKVRKSLLTSWRNEQRRALAGLRMKSYWENPELRTKMSKFKEDRKMAFLEISIPERFKNLEESGIRLDSYGWVKEVSLLWGVSTTQVRRIFERYWKGPTPYRRNPRK